MAESKSAFIDCLERTLSIFEKNEGRFLQDYISAEVKIIDPKFGFDDVFESILETKRVLCLLHMLPQDFIQQIRQLKSDGNFDEGLSSKINQLDFGKNFVGDILVQVLPTKNVNTAKKVKGRKAIFPAVVHALLGVERDKHEPNSDNSFLEYSALLSRVKKAGDSRLSLGDRTEIVDLYRFMLDPYRLSMNMRTKLLESIIFDLKELLDSLVTSISDGMPLLQRHPTKTFEDKNIPKDKISNSAYSTQQPTYPDTNASNRSRVLLGDEISRKQRVLDSLPLITSFVFAVHASLPYNDRALDTDSISGTMLFV